MITGVNAARHDVLLNGDVIFGEHREPPRIEPWIDKEKMVHVPEVYDLARENGLTTAQVDWVAIHHAHGIQWRFPELPDPDGEVERDLIAQGVVTAEQLRDFNKSSSAWRDQIRIDAVADILGSIIPTCWCYTLLTSITRTCLRSDRSRESYVNEES